MYRKVNRVAVQSTALRVRNFQQTQLVTTGASGGTWSIPVVLSVLDYGFFQSVPLPGSFTILPFKYHIKSVYEMLLFYNQSDVPVEVQTWSAVCLRDIPLAEYPTYTAVLNAQSVNINTSPAWDPVGGDVFRTYFKITKFPSSRIMNPGKTFRRKVSKYFAQPYKVSENMVNDPNFLALKGTHVGWTRFRAIPLYGTGTVTGTGFPSVSIPYYLAAQMKFYENDSILADTTYVGNTISNPTTFGRVYEEAIGQTVATL